MIPVNPHFKKPPMDAGVEKSLRDYLAIDRTVLANRRTLLSFVRTGIYFFFTGLAILHIEALHDFAYYIYPLFGLGVLVIIAGFISYFRVRKRILLGYRLGKDTQVTQSEKNPEK